MSWSARRSTFADVRALFDRWLYRHPFEGWSARRYAALERPAFGALDARLLDAMAPDMASARRLLDLGCGPRTFATLAVTRWPGIDVIALDPSREFARREAGVGVVRAAGEALPLADRSIDVALCLSSIRHVRDRAATLCELRRVVRGTLWIVELDPDADVRRVTAHAAALGSPLLRHAFAPLVVRTAPAMERVIALARTADWQLRSRRDDPEQPVYILELA
jgi:ubiquinone/menaquinone biosynthesis C-methylase UbiE